MALVCVKPEVTLQIVYCDKQLKEFFTPEQLVTARSSNLLLPNGSSRWWFRDKCFKYTLPWFIFNPVDPHIVYKRVSDDLYAVIQNLFDGELPLDITYEEVTEKTTTQLHPGLEIFTCIGFRSNIKWYYLKSEE